MANPIALSIPGFFVLMGVELYVARRRGQAVYKAADTVNNLHLGIGQQVTGVMSLGLMFAIYVWIYDAWALTTWPMHAWWAWVLCFVVQDFLYYWFHRMSHEVSFLWAAHAVHHQSEQYNLSVALRQSWVQPFFSAWFYFPLAIMGVPPLMYATVTALNTLYQFWIHTELIGRMGWLEKIINTPSHHRVHHGTDAEYVDRNHAGMLIIWDKLFGTFIEEKQRPRYGTLAPLRSFEPVWANVQVWRLLWHKARAAKTWSDKIAVWLKPPGWVPPGVELPAPPHGKPTDDDYALYWRPLSGSRAVYVGVQFFAMAAGVFLLLMQVADHSTTVILLWSAGLMWTLIAVGGVIDGRRWGPWLEAARLAALVAVGVGLWASETAPAVGSMLFVFGLGSSALGAWTTRHHAGEGLEVERA